MPRVPAVSLAVALAALMALAVETGTIVPAVATVFVAQVLLATAPSPLGSDGSVLLTPQRTAVLIGGATASVVAVHPNLLFGAQTTASLESLRPGVVAGLLLGMAAGLVAAIVAQVARTDGRPHLVESLAAVSSLVVFASLAAAWVAAARAPAGREMVSVGCAAVLVSLGVSLIPFERMIVTPAALLLAAAAGAGASEAVAGVAPLWYAAGVGLAAAGFAQLGLSTAAAWSDGRAGLASAWGMAGSLAFVLVGPLVFVAGDILAARA